MFISRARPRSALGRSHPRLARVLAVLLAVGAWSALLLAVGARLQGDDMFRAEILPHLRAGLSWPGKTWRAMQVEPERLVIDMAWEDTQRLELQRQQGIEQGVLMVASGDFANATITNRDETTRVRVRLKGDGPAQLFGKLSYRIRTRDEQTILGMKQLSLHHPAARNWMFEWLAQKAMRREGVIALRYEFVDVTFNGRSLGIYGLEEHFEKHLIENNARPEGPILRFGEDLLWSEIAQQGLKFRGAMQNGVGDYLASEIDSFRTASALAEEPSRSRLLDGFNRLEMFRRGELTTSEVFDVEQLATYFALVDVFGGEHGARWHNIRFYYNPISTRLEPIAFDLTCGIPTGALSCSPGFFPGGTGRLVPMFEYFQRSLFSDAAFLRRYLEELRRLSDPAWLDTLLVELETEMERALAILYRDYPDYEFSPSVLYENQRYIQSVLHPVQALRAHVQSHADGRLRLSVGNLQFLPVDLLGVEFADGRNASLAALQIAPRKHDELVDYRSIDVELPAPVAGAAPQQEVTLLYEVLGSGETRRILALPFPLDLEVSEPEMLAGAADVSEFPFLIADEERKTIDVLPGSWRVERDLLIPSGYIVRAGPGTTLDLVASALVVSYSPLQWIGSEEAPIVVRSSDGTGQGLAVLEAGGPSQLASVRFEGLRYATRGGWVRTGAVTFYESPVSFSDCAFIGGRCEDGLHLVRTVFELTDCLFADCESDAFDADFCQGKMTRTVVRGTGGDALDMSGSVVELEGVEVERCGDKAMSVGEASRVNAHGVRARDVRIGLASKDNSLLAASDVVIERAEYGLSAFQKKPEYGPAEMRIRGLVMNGVQTPYLIEVGSQAHVDGLLVGPPVTGIKELLYAEELSAGQQ